MTAPVRIEAVTVGGTPAAWRALGFVVADVAGAATIPLHGTSLIVIEEAKGVVGMCISGAIDAAPIDGITIEVVEPAANPTIAMHPVGATELDHVVIRTNSLERTCGAIADALGAPLKRIRDLGEIRQGFHRVGGLILEVVEQAAATEPASLWGVVVNVTDLDAAVTALGDDISAAKDAVQPGRRIATVRDTAGVGFPLALMSPPTPR